MVAHRYIHWDTAKMDIQVAGCPSCVQTELIDQLIQFIVPVAGYQPDAPSDHVEVVSQERPQLGVVDGLLGVTDGKSLDSRQYAGQQNEPHGYSHYQSAQFVERPEEGNDSEDHADPKARDATSYKQDQEHGDKTRRGLGVLVVGNHTEEITHRWGDPTGNRQAYSHHNQVNAHLEQPHGGSPRRSASPNNQDYDVNPVHLHPPLR